MTDKEKLIDLINEIQDSGIVTVCSENSTGVYRPPNEFLANHLLANGVTFATDTNDGSKWISVEDDKPKHRGEYFVSYVFADCDMRFYGSAFWHDDMETNGYVTGPHFSNEGVNGMKVTHWMEIQKLPRVQEVPNGTDHA